MDITIPAETTNGVTLPTLGSSTFTYPDTAGGFLYTVHVLVECQTVGDIQKQIEDAKAQVVAAQNIVDMLAPQVQQFQDVQPTPATLQ